MTSHLDEGAINALLDGEIPSDRIPALQAHLDGCDLCRSRLEEARGLRDEALALIETLDGAAGGAGPARVVPLRPARRNRRAWVTGLAWAATVSLAVAAGYWARGFPAPDQEPETQLAAAAPAEGSGAEEAKRADVRQERPAADPEPPARPSPESRALVREQQARPAPTPAPPAPRSEPVANQAATPAAALRDSRLRDADEAPRKLAAAARESNDAAGPPRDTARAAAQPDTVVMVMEAARAPAGAASLVVGRAATGVDAIRMLGGSLRLIDGLVPERIETAGDSVRVVYSTAWGPLVLTQWREGAALRTRLAPPPAAPADSVAAWRRRAEGGR